MYTVTFLRHGESEGVQRKILQGHLDLPLTPYGKEQVRALAQSWLESGRTFEKIFCSPLKRARETAQIVADAYQLPVFEDPAWMECDFGEAEGCETEKVRNWYANKPRPAAFEPVFETGDTEWNLHLRAGAAISTLMAHPSGNYLVVSHGYFLNATLHMIFGILPHGRSLPAEFDFSPAGYATLIYNPTLGRWRLQQLSGSPIVNR